jgi:hypothetical protein
MNINSDKTLVEVGSSTSHPLVVAFDGLEKSWATLSHCWGLRRNLITTTANIEARKAKRSLLDLPPLYKDAILNEAILEKFLRCNCEICL